MKQKDKYPEQHRNHIIGDRALAVFNYYRRPYWIPNESRRDYGWDIIITISEEGQAKEHFFVQLKGSESPKYIQEGTIISFPLEIKTINFLLLQRIPPLLCLCYVDIEEKRKDEPIYYVWIHEAIPDIEKKRQIWRENAQETVNIHIPTINRFNKDACTEIEAYVKKYYQVRKIKETIGEVVLPALGQEATRDIYSSQDDLRTILPQKITPLQKAGIIDIIQEDDEKKVEALSPEDQERSRKLQHISKILHDLNDREAEKSLTELSGEIENASDGIKAKYHNVQGILFLHKGEYEPAIYSFKNAHELRSQEHKYILNLLLAQHIAVEESESVDISLSNEWNAQLDAVLSEEPDNCQALRLKASWIGINNSIEEAESFLRNSPCWEKDPVSCRSYLATTYSSVGDLVNAERLLREAESLNLELDVNFWSLLGSILLKKSLGIYEPVSEFVVHGSGPSTLDIESLKAAGNCFQKAFEEFKERGFSYFSSEMVANYAVTLRLLGNLEEEERICRIFLEHDAQQPAINLALATCLAIQHKIHPAIKYARIAYNNNDDTTNYKILALCYLNAESFDELLQLTSERRKNGFYSKEEEGFSLAFSAIAYNEIGEYEQVEKLLNQLKSDTAIAKEAVFAEVAIAKKNNDSRQAIISLYKDALKNYPEDVQILVQYLEELQPVTKQTAEEVIHCIKIIATQCQLTPKIIYQLEQAYLQQDNLEAADKILESAIERYPSEPEFLYERAKVQVQLGDEEQSFQLLQQYLQYGKHSYTVLHNLAWLASEIDRLDEAVTFFEQSLSKARDKKLRGAIHCQLYELRKKRGDRPKQILRHVVEFGKTVDDVEQEAKFLTMFIVAMFGLTWDRNDYDEEIIAWNKEAKERFSTFSKKYPNFPALQAFEIPDGLPETEYLFYLKVQLAQAMLPYELASAPLKLAARSHRYPLASRSQYFTSGHSIFDYWPLCTESKKSEHAIHIWYPENIYEQEKRAIARSKTAVCVDITALLTLAELDQLNILPQYFTRIIITRGTKNTLRREFNGLERPSPLVQKIEDWRLANRKFIRVRTVDILDAEVEEEDSFVKTPGGIFLQREYSLETLLGDEMGESLSLAKKLGIALYSDESAIRQSAVQNFGVDSFCSVALFEHLREEGYITICHEAALLAEMIRKNFRVVPFSVEHLNALLERIWEEAQNEGKPFSQDSLQQHEAMGTLIRQFGETSIHEEKLIQVAVHWWQTILINARFERKVVVECMLYPIFCLSMRTQGGVLTKIPKYEQEERVAYILAHLLWLTYIRHEGYTGEAWSCIKDCVQERFPDNQKIQMILYTFIPQYLLDISGSDNSIEHRKKSDFLVQLPLHFPQADRERFERVLAPKLVR